MAGEEDKKVTELEGQVTELLSKVAELSTQLETAAGDNPDLTELLSQTGELTKALETALADKAALEKALDALKKAQEIEKAMTADEKDYCSGMSSDQKDSFMAKSPEDRKKAMAKSAADDETVTIEGRPIKKSVVGDDVFAIMKAQSDRINASNVEIAKERDAREMAELTKRADDEFGHVPGTAQERAAMLKAMGKMEEPLRKTFEAVFIQSEKLAKGAFDKLGTKGGKDGPASDSIKKAATDFESKVSEIRARDKLSQTDALAKARKENPDMFKAYQEVEQTN